MLIQHFSSLNPADQENVIWNHGILLANYDEGNFTSDVYQMFNFYTSVSFDIRGNVGSSVAVNILRAELPVVQNYLGA